MQQGARGLMRPSHRRAAGQRATARVQGFPQRFTFRDLEAYRTWFAVRGPVESRKDLQVRMAAKRLLFRLEDLRKEQADGREDEDG